MVSNSPKTRFLKSPGSVLKKERLPNANPITRGTMKIPVSQNVLAVIKLFKAQTPDAIISVARKNAIKDALEMSVPLGDEK